MYIYGHRWGKGSPAAVKEFEVSIETKPSIEIVCKWKGCHRPAHIGRPVSTPLGIRTFCNDHVNAALKLDGCESFRNASPAGRSFSEEKEPKRLCSWKGCQRRDTLYWSNDTKYRVRGLPRGKQISLCFNCLQHMHAWFREQTREQREADERRIHAQEAAEDGTTCHCKLCAPQAPAAKESTISCSWTSFSTQTIDGVEKRIPAPCPSIASVTIKSKHGPLSVCNEHSSVVPAQTQEVA